MNLSQPTAEALVQNQKENHMNIKHLVGAIAVIAGSLAAQPSANAGPNQVITSGFQCQKHGSAGSVAYYNQGQVTNNSTTSKMRVRCPVSRHAHYDNFSLTVSVQDKNPYWDYDNNRSANVFCSVYDSNRYGSSWHWTGWKGTSGNSGNTLVTFTDNNMYDHSRGGVHILCDIPEKTNQGDTTRIGSYSIGAL